MRCIEVIRCPKGFRRLIEETVGKVYMKLNLNEPVIVRFAKSEEFFGIHNVNSDMYKEDASEITLNVWLFFLKPIELFRTICHEMYHCYQRENRYRVSEKNAERACHKKFNEFYSSFKKEFTRIKNEKS